MTKALQVACALSVALGAGALAAEPVRGRTVSAAEPARARTESAAEPARARTESAAEPARVRTARARVEPAIRALFAKGGAHYPPRALLLRAFKLEGALELWAEPRRGAPYLKLREYRICASSGEPGPKRRSGDEQVPEGFYRISALNPWSSYHLSLRIDYPNKSDRILGARGALGGDIFIHGKCVTIGCLPLGDEAIEELFVIAADAHAKGAPIAVHLFPARMDEAGFEKLLQRAEGRPGLRAFWEQLREGDRLFEKNKRPPRIRVLGDGSYSFKR